MRRQICTPSRKRCLAPGGDQNTCTIPLHDEVTYTVTISKPRTKWGWEIAKARRLDSYLPLSTSDTRQLVFVFLLSAHVLLHEARKCPSLQILEESAASPPISISFAFVTERPIPMFN